MAVSADAPLIEQRDRSRRRVRATLAGAVAIAAAVLVAYGLVPRRGFVGEYCADPDFGTTVYRQITPEIAFDWRDDAPARVYHDHFSIRWTGELEVPADDAYTFFVDADGGVRLLVDGEVLADRWREDGPIELRPSKRLGAGAHTLALEFVDRGGEARVSLGWSSTSFDRRIVRGGPLR